MNSKVKAYGKLLIFGSYAILEPGNIGFVANVDRGTTAIAEQTHTGRIVIDLKNFQILTQGERKGSKIELEEENERLIFVKNAVEYSFEYLNLNNIEVRDVRLDMSNDAEFYLTKKLKTGFGSSATATVSTVASILKLHEIDDRDIVFKIAYYSHYKSQGNMGSGFDIAAACFGSHFFIAPDVNMKQEFKDYINSNWTLERQNYDASQVLIPVIIFTGKSASTKEMVEKVLKFKSRHPTKYHDFMKDYNYVNFAIKKAFDENYKSRLKHFLEKSWLMRKQLGKMCHVEIETDNMTRELNDMKNNGAFTAGLTGAGGGDNIIAFCESKEKKEILLEFLKKRKFIVLEEVNLVNREYEILI